MSDELRYSFWLEWRRSLIRRRRKRIKVIISSRQGGQVYIYDIAKGKRRISTADLAQPPCHRTRTDLTTTVNRRKTQAKNETKEKKKKRNCIARWKRNSLIGIDVCFLIIYEIFTFNIKKFLPQFHDRLSCNLLQQRRYSNIGLRI